MFKPCKAFLCVIKLNQGMLTIIDIIYMYIQVKSVCVCLCKMSQSKLTAFASFLWCVTKFKLFNDHLLRSLLPTPALSVQ